MPNMRDSDMKHWTQANPSRLAIAACLSMSLLVPAAFADEDTAAEPTKPAATTKKGPAPEAKAGEPKSDENPDNPAKKGQPSLDDLLDLPPVKPNPDKPDKPNPNKPDPNKVGDPLDPKLKRELTMEQAADELKKAIEEMADAASRLQGAKDPGIETQRIQQAVLAKLDQVISAAKRQQQQQQQQQQSSSSQQQQQNQGKRDTGSKQNEGKQQGKQQGKEQGKKPGEKDGQQQGKKPGDKDGKQQGKEQGKQNQGGKDNKGNAQRGSVTGVDSAKAIEELRKEWGNLPPRLRDELLQGLRERISPIYRKSTEEYYRLLAEETGKDAE